MPLEPACILRPIPRFHVPGSAGVQVVALVAREHVKVIVPHVLVAGWLVVLARRDTIAGVDGFHSKGERLRHLMNTRAQGKRQIVQVLEVLVRDDEDVPKVVGVLMCTDESGHRFVLADDVGGDGQHVLVLDPGDQQAEGAGVIRGSMRIHGGFIYLGDSHYGSAHEVT